MTLCKVYKLDDVCGFFHSTVQIALAKCVHLCGAVRGKTDWIANNIPLCFNRSVNPCQLVNVEKVVTRIKSTICIIYIS